MKFHSFINDPEGWKTLSLEEHFSNPFLQVYTAKVRTPLRPEGCEWTVTHRKGAVVIVPLTAEGDFVLVRQERIPIRAAIWEFPAGQIDVDSHHSQEVIEAAARRELLEETGHELAPGGELRSLGYYFSSAGFTDEHCHILMARPVIPVAQGMQPDENEAICESRAFGLSELKRMIASGEIRDANTLSAFARLSASGII